MTILLLQLICLFLGSVGTFFIFLELKTNFDRSFLYFGLSLVFLCCLTLIDIWFINNSMSTLKILYWTKIFHILSCFFYVFSIWYLMELAKNNNTKLIKIWTLSGIIFSLFLIQDGVMLKMENNQVLSTILYNVTFVPYTIIWVVLLNYINIKAISKAPVKDKKIFKIHLFGIISLCLFGLLDLFAASLLGQKKLPIPSFSIIGVLVFGIMASLIFAERFLILIKDRQYAYDKLEAAYKDMEKSATLKQLGESTAIINHEIKNYMIKISGMAEIIKLKERLSYKGKQHIETIIKSIMSLNAFSKDILDLSKKKITKGGKLINIGNVIKNCIKIHFSNEKDFFTLYNFDKCPLVYGDWVKLEQVFINLFNNSIEASPKSNTKISIRLKYTNDILLIIIEDNGKGCSIQEIKNIFKAFYTTKTSHGQGTGLGMSISKTIIESHGGRISAYSKNVRDSNTHGLIINIAFPVYNSSQGHQDIKNDIVLIKEGIEPLESVIRIFQNINVTPNIIQEASDLENKKFFNKNVEIIGNAASIEKINKQFPNYKNTFLLKEHKQIPYILNTSKENKPYVFSEEFIFANLI